MKTLHRNLVVTLSNSPSVATSDSELTNLLSTQPTSQEPDARAETLSASETQSLSGSETLILDQSSLSQSMLNRAINGSISNKPISDKPTLKCELEVFSSTFLTIFLAELGDKTQLTTLLMSAQSQSPWVVFAGAGAALVLTSLLGILLGRWLATKVAPKTLEASSGVLLLVIAAMLCWDVLRS